MKGKIKKDQERLHRLLKDKAREKIKGLIKKGELIGRRGKDTISIPVPEIEIPVFRHGGPRTKGGVGQGDGELGQPVGYDPNAPESGEAGEQPGEHILETEFTFEEIAKIIAENLGLPYLESKGKETIEEKKTKYTGIYVVGPESLRHRRRTYKETLKREFSGLDLPEDASEEKCDEELEFILNDPDRQVPLPPDRRYKSWEIKKEEIASAVMIFMIDVSGSMGEKEKEIVRNMSWLTRIYILGQPRYKKTRLRWIIHDATAKEVDEYEFFHTRESGGTKISSAYRLCRDIIVKDYPLDEWNIYAFHFSDGDNWGGGDTKICVELLKNELLPAVNRFCYGQVESSYGAGAFARDLKNAFPKNPKSKLRISSSDLKLKEQDYASAMKKFLKEGE